MLRVKNSTDYYLVVIDVEILDVVGVEALDDVETDEDVDAELDVDMRRRDIIIG